MSATWSVTKIRETDTPTSLRLKLRHSEIARERVEAQLSAEQNIHAAGRRWDFLCGVALGTLLTLTVLGMCGAF